jgi:hypothetical protein
MNRFLLTPFVLFAIAPLAAGQDMPLSQILIDGEGWKKSTGAMPASSAPQTTSPDGSTTFRWEAKSGLFIEARQTKAAAHVPFAPYCPLRVLPGTAPSVTAMTTDRDGRIYAATPLGVQVYDPTGRLCGVVAAPAAGTVQGLSFEDDLLIASVGETRYARKLRTRGVK